jgi:hypothetical protein
MNPGIRKIDMIFIGIGLILLAGAFVVLAVLVRKGLENIIITIKPVKVNFKSDSGFLAQMGTRVLSPVIQQELSSRQDDSEDIRASIKPDLSAIADMKVETNMDPETDEFKSNPAGYIKTIARSLKKTRGGRKSK